MRFILYNLVYESGSIHESANIDKYIPNLHSIKIENNKLLFDEGTIGKKLFLSTHFSYNQIKNFPIDKIIIVIRNPLDVLVSLINYYKLDLKKIDELVDEFATTHNLDFLKNNYNFPSWSEHIDSYKNSNKNFIFINYSKLLNEFEKQIENLCNFLEIDYSSLNINDIKKNTSFENLKSIEIKEKENNLDGFFTRSTKDKNIHFMNLGKSNGYKDLLTDMQILKLNESTEMIYQQFI